MDLLESDELRLLEGLLVVEERRRRNPQAIGRDPSNGRRKEGGK